MDDNQLKRFRDELVKGSNQAQKSMMLPAEVKAMLLNAAKVVSELADREIARNGKGEQSNAGRYRV